METKTINEIIERAIDLLEEFSMDEDVTLYPDERDKVVKTIEKVAPKVAEVARDLGLPNDVAASIVFAVAMYERFHVSYIFVEESVDKVVESLKRLGYKQVDDKCIHTHIEATLKAGWDVAENVAIANKYSYIVVDTPKQLFVFE